MNFGIQEADPWARRRADFESHLQRLKREMAETSAEMSAQLERMEQYSTSSKYAAIRRYSGVGVSSLFDLIAEFRTEIESLMQAIPGFVSYSLFRTADGGASFTVCSDKAGVDQSARIAHDWIIEHANDLHTADPQIIEGEVVAHLR